METNAAGGLLSVSDLVGLTRFKKCLSFLTSSISDHLKTGCCTRLKSAFLVSDSPLSAKQSLEGWHLSFICSFLLAKMRFIQSMTLIDKALSCKWHSYDTVLLERWLWLSVRPRSLHWCGTSQCPEKLLQEHHLTSKDWDSLHLV